MDKAEYLILNPKIKINILIYIVRTPIEIKFFSTCEPTEFVGDNGEGVLPFGTSEKPHFVKYSVIVF